MTFEHIRSVSRLGTTIRDTCSGADEVDVIEMTVSNDSVIRQKAGKEFTSARIFPDYLVPAKLQVGFIIF